MDDFSTPLEKGFMLSREQVNALERIARHNKSTPSVLVSLAVDALLSEAAQNDGWLLIPKIKQAG